MNNFLKRVVTGTSYVGIITVALFIHPIALIAVTSAMLLLALNEFRTILSPGSNRYWVYVLSFTFVLTALTTSFKLPAYLSITALFLFCIYMVLTALFTSDQQAVQIFSIQSAALLYITLPLLLLNSIHLIGIQEQTPYVFILFIFIWANDSFAYLTGISLGKHRLFERISPKKSWEGFFGGFMATLLISYGIYEYLGHQSLLFWMLFAFITVIAATLGDLFESLIKRNAHVKDSGNILPGHGGMLDRIDSLLFVSPVIYVFLLFYK